MNEGSGGSPSRVIGAGAASPIGSHVAASRRGRGWTLTAVDRRSSAAPAGVAFFEMECGPSIVADAERIAERMYGRPVQGGLESVVRCGMAWERARAASPSTPLQGDP